MFSDAELQKVLCWAGRWADLGGKWDHIPDCYLPPIHVIGHDNPTIPPIRLCQPHFEEALASGSIEQPFLSQDVAEKLDPRIADYPDVDP